MVDVVCQCEFVDLVGLVDLFVGDEVVVDGVLVGVVDQVVDYCVLGVVFEQCVVFVVGGVDVVQ